MELILVTIFLMGLVIWLFRNKLPKPRPVETGIVHIVVENEAANKTKSSDRHAIINEAEVLFQSLQKKYLYSPLPFKVLGDFYVQKGLSDKALEKYGQMIHYLNDDLSLEKLKNALTFMHLNGAGSEALSIEMFYQSKEEQ